MFIRPIVLKNWISVSSFFFLIQNDSTSISSLNTIQSIYMESYCNTKYQNYELYWMNSGLLLIQFRLSDRPSLQVEFRFHLFEIQNDSTSISSLEMRFNRFVWRVTAIPKYQNYELYWINSGLHFLMLYNSLRWLIERNRHCELICGQKHELDGGWHWLPSDAPLKTWCPTSAVTGFGFFFGSFFG